MNAEVQPWAALPTPPPWRGDLSPYRVGQGPPLPVALSGFQLMQITQQAQGAAPWARLARRPWQRPLGGRDRWTEGRGCGQQGALERSEAPCWAGHGEGGAHASLLCQKANLCLPPARATFWACWLTRLRVSGTRAPRAPPTSDLRRTSPCGLSRGGRSAAAGSTFVTGANFAVGAYRPLWALS